MRGIPSNGMVTTKPFSGLGSLHFVPSSEDNHPSSNLYQQAILSMTASFDYGVLLKLLNYGSQLRLSPSSAKGIVMKAPVSETLQSKILERVASFFF